MKVVEVCVGKQDQVNRGQVLDAHARPFETFQQEQPIGKIRINQHVEVRELHEKRRMADPGQSDLPITELGKNRFAGLPHASGQQGLPDHLAKEGAGIEMLGWRQIFK